MLESQLTAWLEFASENIRPKLLIHRRRQSAGGFEHFIFQDDWARIIHEFLIFLYPGSIACELQFAINETAVWRI